MHVRNLRVSDVGIRLYSPDARMGAVIDDRMSAYLDEEDGPTDFNVRLDPGAESVTTQGRVHDVRRLEAGRLQLERDGCLAAVVDFATGLGHAHLVPDRWGMDSLVRLLLAAHLPQIGGTLVHAAGTVFEGCGIVIPGVSGAGKSTLLAHIGGDPVLSDEIVAVRLDGEGVHQVHATPFDRLTDKGLPVSAPLKGIVFPDRTLPEGLHRLSRSDALFRLLQTVVCYGSDANLDRQLMNAASDLASAVPCHAISFRLGQPVQDLIRSILEE